MANITTLDTLVKEFLVFRGFTATLRAFDSELRWAGGEACSSLPLIGAKRTF